METETKTESAGKFSVSVLSNTRICPEFYKLKLELKDQAAELFANCRPGQFVEMDLSGCGLPPAETVRAELADKTNRNILLRRPFSFSNVEAKDGHMAAEFIYRTAGPATTRMTTLKAQDKLDIIGPLGNGFNFPDEKDIVLLVCGGTGAGPILHMARFMAAKHSSVAVTAFVGARDKESLPFKRISDSISQEIGFSLPEFSNLAIESAITTDDGSVGLKGFVTDGLTSWLSSNNIKTSRTIIYACGPEPMLKKLAQIAKDRKIDCQLSMERTMACGTGLCQGCAVECRDKSGEKIYKMCCKDGPVFDSTEVVF